MPTQLALKGAKTTRPSLAIVAPANFESCWCGLGVLSMTDEMSTQLKALLRLLVGSKMPTQSALYGAKTTRPSLVVVAPLNQMAPRPFRARSDHTGIAGIAAQLKSLDSCRPRPDWMSACICESRRWIGCGPSCVYTTRGIAVEAHTHSVRPSSRSVCSPSGLGSGTYSGL